MISQDAWNADGRSIWERDGKKCVRCERELPDCRDCRPDRVAGETGEEIRAFCVCCYILRGDARRWRTANIGAMVAAGILPRNWRDLVWFESKGQTA